MHARFAMAMFFGLTLALLGLQSPGKAPQVDSISKDDLRADLFFLASDAMQGRLTDTPGNEIAMEYVKSRFERMGLKPGGPGGSFFQPYNLMTATLGDGNSLEVIESEGSRLVVKAGQDFFPMNFSGSGKVRGSVVFAGFGISAPGYGHEDYKGDAVRGKIVLVVDHEPGENDSASAFDGVVTSEASTAFRKALYAQEKGAAAILFVSDLHNHEGPLNFEATARTAWPGETPRVRRFTLATWADRIRIPALQISPSLAEGLIRGLGKKLLDLSRESEVKGGVTPLSVPGPQIELVARVNRHVIPDRNVLAMVEGSDPRLKDELVIVSAHIDHDGADGPRIFNGADDNGSGTVALLEIAEAYALAAKAGQRPRRSVLLAVWNSEERGLLGAWAYTESPTVPLNRIAGVLNMDMIGRNEEVPVGGGNRFRGLELQTAESNSNAINIMGTTRTDMKGQVEESNKAVGLTLRFRYDNNMSNLMRRSDQWPFLQTGVPAVFFHTGLHPDYHTVYDRPEKINYEKMEKIARLVHQTSWTLATQDARPELLMRPYWKK